SPVLESKVKFFTYLAAPTDVALLYFVGSLMRSFAFSSAGALVILTRHYSQGWILKRKNI
ncbi:hypothetical protein MUB24_21520, partial [Lederbergia sp. NSJ-179]|uniref:hypothetical protein n=1 Tax=Lederbergia sp. NSJ-179 TaxID=2931402 RepID=UPI001FD219C6